MALMVQMDLLKIFSHSMVLNEQTGIIVVAAFLIFIWIDALFSSWVVDHANLQKDEAQVQRISILTTVNAFFPSRLNWCGYCRKSSVKEFESSFLSCSYSLDAILFVRIHCIGF